MATNARPKTQRHRPQPRRASALAALGAMALLGALGTTPLAHATEPACPEIQLNVVDANPCVMFTRYDCGAQISVNNQCDSAVVVDEVGCTSCGDAVTVQPGETGYVALARTDASQTFVWSQGGKSGQLKTTIRYYDQSAGEDLFVTCQTGTPQRGAPIHPALWFIALIVAAELFQRRVVRRF